MPGPEISLGLGSGECFFFANSLSEHKENEELVFLEWEKSSIQIQTSDFCAGVYYYLSNCIINS